MLKKKIYYPLIIKNFIDYKGNTKWVIVDSMNNIMPLGIHESKTEAQIALFEYNWIN